MTPTKECKYCKNDYEILEFVDGACPECNWHSARLCGTLTQPIETKRFKKDECPGCGITHEDNELIGTTYRTYSCSECGAAGWQTDNVINGKLSFIASALENISKRRNEAQTVQAVADFFGVVIEIKD